MILVTVGNHSQPFDRLVKTMDELATHLNERVVIQRGCSKYKPQFAEHFQWTTSLQMEQLTEESRVVVGHAGSGTIIITIQKGKPLVIVPRLKQYGEHFDDHQLQLARAMEARGRAIVVNQPTIELMKDAILKATSQISSYQKVYEQGPTLLIDALRRQLKIWLEQD